MFYLHAFASFICSDVFLKLKEQFMALRTEKAKRLWFSDFDHFGLRAIEALEAEIVKLARLR